MKDWPADPAHPAQLSARNTAGCHIVIAMVAFTRGTLVSTDRMGRSITQFEIEAGIKNGAKPLYFLLRDTPENRAAWQGVNDLTTDAELVRWRAELMRDRTVQFFDAGELPDVLPAVTKQIIEWERLRRRRLAAIIAGLVSVLLVASFSLQFSAFLRETALSRFLAWNDPVLFQHARDGKYKIARLLEGRSDIQDSTNLRAELAATQQTFEMFANTFGSFRDYEGDFEDMAKRGVKLKFVVTDFSPENRGNWEPFAKVTSERNLDETLAEAANIRHLIHGLHQRFPKQVEYKLNRKPIFYTMWLRDAGTKNALGHLGVNFYLGKSNWPAFRVSNVTGRGQIESLSMQFEHLWNDSISDPDQVSAQ